MAKKEISAYVETSTGKFELNPAYFKEQAKTTEETAEETKAPKAKTKAKTK